MKLVQLRRPFVVGIVVERTVTAAERAAGAAFGEGADAVELAVNAQRDPEKLDAGFFARLGRPIYVSHRRPRFMRLYGPRFARLPAVDEEERMARQLALIGAGAAGIDIEADTFAPSPDEWTRNRTAIRKQAEVAAAAHRRRAAVIGSWHPPRKLSYGEASRAARSLRDRGADFVKIVERVRSSVEAYDSFGISLRLADTLDFPFVFLPLGPGAEEFRPFMTAFGAAYILARPSLGSNRLAAQPLVERARVIADFT